MFTKWAAAFAAFFTLAPCGFCQTFSYSYQSVLDPNADAYIVGVQNARKYHESFQPRVAYWGPAQNNAVAKVTSRFDLQAPIANVHLKAMISSYNFGNERGNASLWGSKDGLSWVNLLDSPTPTSEDSYKFYNQAVPETLLGGTSFWLEARMSVTGSSNNDYTMAQFSRSIPLISDEVFAITITPVPEPRLCGLVCVAGAMAWSTFSRISRRKSHPPMENSDDAGH